MRVRDGLGVLFQDADFAAAFPARGGPGMSPGMLAVVSVMQFAERLTDRQAADAVRGRIDWKYLLGLELEDEGFHFSVLSGFRERLVEYGREQVVLDRLLARLSELGFLRAGGRVRTDATHVLALVRDLNRLEFCAETLRCALEALAVTEPDWLRAASGADSSWQDRYGARADSYRLPKGEPERGAFAVQVGTDGFALLEAVHRPDAPTWLRQLPAVQVLRRAWIQQYHRDSRGEGGQGVRRREGKDLPPGSKRLVSPHDPDARCGGKRGMLWDGYKVHYSETCEEDLPHLIASVTTTSAAVDDSTQVQPVHDDLARRGLQPGEHLVDGGYTSAAIVLAARAQGIDLVGPLPPASDRHRLGHEASHLPAWGEEPLLGNHAYGRAPAHRGHLPRVRLPHLPSPALLHHRLHPAADPAPPRGARTPPTPTCRAGHRRLEAALRQACRRRGHHLPSRPHHQHPAQPLPRPGQDRPRPRAQRRRDQPPPHGSPLDRATHRHHPAYALRRPRPHPATPPEVTPAP
jgi:transposase